MNDIPLKTASLDELLDQLRIAAEHGKTRPDDALAITQGEASIICDQIDALRADLTAAENTRTAAYQERDVVIEQRDAALQALGELLAGVEAWFDERETVRIKDLHLYGPASAWFKDAIKGAQKLVTVRPVDHDDDPANQGHA